MTERETARTKANATARRRAPAAIIVANDRALEAEAAVLRHDHDDRVRAVERWRLVEAFVAAATDAKWKPAEVAFCLKGGPL